MGTRCGLEHVCKLTNYHRVVESLHKVLLKGVGNKVAAIGIGGKSKSVSYNAAGSGTHRVPECSLVVFGVSTRFHIHSHCIRLCGNGSAGSLGHLSVHGLQSLKTRNLLAKIRDLSLHTRIDSIVLCGKSALLGSVGVKECLSSLPRFCTLGAKFSNSHSVFLLFNISKD